MQSLKFELLVVDKYMLVVQESLHNPPLSLKTASDFFPDFCGDDDALFLINCFRILLHFHADKDDGELKLSLMITIMNSLFLPSYIHCIFMPKLL